jgi:hypothetical protein
MPVKLERITRSAAILVRRAISPIGSLWILSHTVLVLLGALFIGNAAIKNSIGQGVADGIGGSLIAGGIAGMTLFLYVFATEALRSRIENFTKAGLLTIFPVRSVLIREQYHDRLSGARQIDLVGYGLSAFRQDYAADFVSWSHRARVRILLIDPDFPTRETSLSDQRDKEESHPVGQTREDVLAFEQTIANLAGLDRGKFQIRRMRSIPAINMFRIDNVIFWGPYLMNQQSRNTATMLVGRGGFLFDMLERLFEALWSQSIPSPIPQ